MKTVLAGVIFSVTLAGCAGQQQIPPTPVVQPAQTVPAAVLSDECPTDRSPWAFDRAPGMPADPHGVIGKSWPQGDSCALTAASMRFIAMDSHGQFRVPDTRGRILHNAAWVGQELEVAAGGFLHVRIPDGMGVTRRTAINALFDASRAVRDTKEQVVGIAASAAATADARQGSFDDQDAKDFRTRVLKVREALDARLSEIGQAVMDKLVPGAQAGRESYLVWGPDTGNVMVPVDPQGHQLDWNTRKLVLGAPVVPMPPIET